MRKRLLIAALGCAMLASSPARSAPQHALILSDEEIGMLKHALDAATRACGLECAPTTVYLSNKLNAAPLVKEQVAPPAPAAAPAAPENKDPPG